MKRFTLFLALLAVICLSFASCEKTKVHYRIGIDNNTNSYYITGILECQTDGLKQGDHIYVSPMNNEYYKLDVNCDTAQIATVLMP